ncbi:hypothetical protein DL96DRAFT_1438531, partial [Flagelloscypha sp. PMI_526]
KFKNLLLSWHALESAYNYEESGARTERFAPNSQRPIEIKDWIARARNKPRAIQNCIEFGRGLKDWWWKNQPQARVDKGMWWRARALDDIDGQEMVSLGSDKEGWGKLMVKGRNGMLSVVAALSWW